VGRRGDETYQKILNALVEFNQAWARSAPVLVLAVAKMTFTQRNTQSLWLARHRATMATLALQATTDGPHTHSMAGFDND